MLTYQVKIRVARSIENEWLNWMKTEHVPYVLATGLIKSFNILKPQSYDNMYFFHYHFSSKGDFEKYQSEFAPKLKNHPLKKFPDQFKAQRELLDWV